jgi:hypothetical protein
MKSKYRKVGEELTQTVGKQHWTLSLELVEERLADKGSEGLVAQESLAEHDVFLECVLIIKAVQEIEVLFHELSAESLGQALDHALELLQLEHAETPRIVPLEEEQDERNQLLVRDADQDVQEGVQLEV